MIKMMLNMIKRILCIIILAGVLSWIGLWWIYKAQIAAGFPTERPSLDEEATSIILHE